MCAKKQTKKPQKLADFSVLVLLASGFNGRFGDTQQQTECTYCLVPGVQSIEIMSPVPVY